MLEPIILASISLMYFNVSSSSIFRLIVANRTLVPIDQVLPVVFTHLPLKEDFEEYHMVFKCILELYTAGEILIKTSMSKILALCASIYETDQDKESEETRPLLEQLVRQVYRDMQPEFAAAVGEMPPAMQEKLGRIVSAAAPSAS